MKNKFDSKVAEFKRALLRELLNKCTDKQKEFFNILYRGIDDIKEEKMRTAYFQCFRTLEKNKKYITGMNMAQFCVITIISSYNHNYCVGIDKDLLFAKSDDDNTTEWWIINGENSVLLGYSMTSEGDKLIKSDTRWT